VYTWPEGGTLALEQFPNDVRHVRLLADEKKTLLKTKQDGATLSIKLPDTAPDPIDSVLCVETARL
jgi:hypothetical protein